MGNPTIDSAWTTWTEVRTRIEEFVATVEVTSSAADHPAGPITEQLAQLRLGWHEFRHRVDTLFADRGDPDALRRYADVWHREITRQLRAVGVTIEPAGHGSHSGWSGAARSYVSMARKQRACVEQLEYTAGDLGDTIRTLAKAIDDFWSATLVSLVTLAATVTGAAVAAATAVRIPAAVGTISATIAAELRAIGDAEATRDALIDECRSGMKTISAGLREAFIELSGGSPDWPAPDTGFHPGLHTG